ncbi:MAG: insulinase family protein [Proteobacteria bacterium]|nr:insulinase family protein [Pseudomonadota bacterium]
MGRLGAVAVLAAMLMMNEGQAMEIQQFKLDNGLNVVVVPDHRVPVVTHSVWYNVGAMDEVPGKTGLAHMTEHLMFKGTPRHPAGEMDKIVQRKGGVQNAFTSYDFTAYFQKVPVQELPVMMDLESDRMAHLTLTDPVFQPERKVVAEERKLTTDSNPADRFMEQVMRRHYAHHTYGHPIIGWRQDIAGYTVNDALDWYHHHYAPNNATLIMVGDITADQARPLAEKYYGAVKPADVPARKSPVEPVRKEALSYIAVDAQVKVPLWEVLFRAPSRFHGVADAKPAKGEATALWALAEIVGGSDSARLYQRLVVKDGLADDASAGYDAIRVGETTWDVSVQPKDGVTADKIGPVVWQVLQDVVDHGVTQAELDKAKTTLLADEIYGRDDVFNTMYRLGVWVTAGGDVKHFDDWQGELRTLTTADVQAVAKKYLKSEASTLAVLVGKPAQLGTLQPTKDN